LKEKCGTFRARRGSHLRHQCNERLAGVGGHGIVPGEPGMSATEGSDLGSLTLQRAKSSGR
jgi:hypothetical protein